MNIPQWKSELPATFNKMCTEIHINDACIDLVDIIFEQIGNARSCPPHSHTWFEFNYVLSGHVQTRFSGEPITVGEGQFILIPPGRVHSHVYTRGNPHEGICIRWRIKANGNEPQPSSFLERLNTLNDWKPVGYADRYGIRALLLQLFDEAGTDEGSSVLSLQLILIRLLDALTRVHQSDESRENATEEKDMLIKKVDVYLGDFQGKQLNVEELAASLHLSYGHLSRLYKSRTGHTLIERMNQIRLDKACRLLEQPALLIKEVAEQAGFPDIYYFSKVFKKKLGLSPQIYRIKTLSGEGEAQIPH